jgi:bacillopeptidase F
MDMSDAIATDLLRYYRVREQAPPKLFEEGFEDGAEGWTVGVVPGFSATGIAWELGAPSNNGPEAAFAGENVYGTDLDANYEDGTGIFLRSPVIDLTGAGRAKLTFQHFLAAAEGDGGRLNILESDGTLTPEGAGLKLYQAPDGNTGGWAQESIRLPEFDRPIVLEFEVLSQVDDDPINRAGWFIDEIVVD